MVAQIEMWMSIEEDQVTNQQSLVPSSLTNEQHLGGV